MGQFGAAHAVDVGHQGSFYLAGSCAYRMLMLLVLDSFRLICVVWEHLMHFLPFPQGLSMRQIRFRFDGQPINETDTPAQV